MSCFLRQGGDFDLPSVFSAIDQPERKSNSPPCPCRERRDKDGAPAPSPHLKLDLAVMINQLKVCAVGRDKTGAVRASGEGAMRTSKCRSPSLCGSKPRSARILANILPDSSQSFCVGVQDWVVSRQSAEEFEFGRTTNSAQQFREDYRRQTDHTLNGFDPLAMAPCAGLVYQNRCVEDYDVTHRVRRT